MSAYGYHHQGQVLGAKLQSGVVMPLLPKGIHTTYLKSLTDAEDDADVTLNGGLDLAGNELTDTKTLAQAIGDYHMWGKRCQLVDMETYLVALLQDDTALAVADDGPVDLGILELLDADLTGESTVGLVEDVLGGNADLVGGSLAGSEQVEGGRGDDHLGGLVELGLVEVVDDGGNALGSTVPFVVIEC